MYSNAFSDFFPTLLVLILISSQVLGTPVPPQTVNSPSRTEARSLTGDGGLKTWEIVVIVLGAVIAIILIGGIGGACEVMLCTKRKMAQSNAEADAKAETGGNKALELEPGYVEEGASGSGAPTEVEAVDPSRFSWQPEKLTTGEDSSNDRAMSDTDTADSSETTLNGEQSSTNGEDGTTRDLGLEGDIPGAALNGTESQEGQTTDRAIPSEDHAQPDPALSQFVIGGEEDHGFEDEQAGSDCLQQDHVAEPVAMPNEADFQHNSTETHQDEHQGDTSNRGPEGYPSNEHNKGDHGHDGDALAAAPVGAYSGEGYSPAVMPDEVDYLAEYRQSQLYLQQEDDWQQYYGSHDASGTNDEKDGHQEQPNTGYF